MKETCIKDEDFIGENSIASVIDTPEIERLEIERLEIERLKKRYYDLYSMVCKSPSVIFKWKISHKNPKLWKVEFVTKNVYDLFGYTDEDFLEGKISWVDVICPEDLPNFEKEIDKYFKYNLGECTQEYRVHSKDKKTKWVKAMSSPIYNDDLEMIVFQSIITDITSEIVLHQKMLDSIHKWTDLIESTKTAYIIMNENGIVTETNSQMLSLIGFNDPNELIGLDPKSIICSSDICKYDEAIKKILNGEYIKDLELCLLGKKNYKASWISINAGIIENGGRRIFCLIRDISETKVEETKKFIEDQKQRDKLKQSIIRVRDQIDKITQGSAGASNKIL